MLTENEISRTWRKLFSANQQVTQATLDRAEALLDELRPESPLRHRLDAELVELRSKLDRQA